MVISTAKFPPNRIAVCGGCWRRHRRASCRLVAGRDLSGRTCVNPLELGVAPALPGPQNLALRELEALARALLSVLLAFLHSRITRQKSVLPQRWPQLRIESRNRARQSHAHRPRLSAHAAAMRRYHHVHLVGDIRELQRLDPVILPCLIPQIFPAPPPLPPHLPPPP